MIAPIVERLYEEFTNVEMAEVDADASKDILTKYDVTAMPTFLFFHKGAETERVSGAAPNEIRQALLNLSVKNPKAQRVGFGSGSASGDAGPSENTGSGGVDKSLTDLIPKGYEILNDAVHVGEAEILNVKGDDKSALLRDILSTGEQQNLKSIASDADSQVLIFLPFTNKVKVHSILLRADAPEDEEDAQAPSKIKVWANTTGMISFEDAVAGVKALHSSELRAAGENGWREVPLRFVHFQNVNSVVIFLDGDDEDASTFVQRLVLVGSKGESREQGKLEKIGDD